VLVASGGFPERTIVEDFDWTASQQIAGNKAVYVAAAERLLSYRVGLAT